MTGTHLAGQLRLVPREGRTWKHCSSKGICELLLGINKRHLQEPYPIASQSSHLKAGLAPKSKQGILGPAPRAVITVWLWASHLNSLDLYATNNKTCTWLSGEGEPCLSPLPALVGDLVASSVLVAFFFLANSSSCIPRKRSQKLILLC